MKGVTAVLDANIEKPDSEQGNVGIAMINVVDDGSSSLTRSRAFLGVYKIGNFEAQSEIGFIVLGTAGSLDEALELGGGSAGRWQIAPAVASRGASRSGLHCEGGTKSMSMRMRTKPPGDDLARASWQ